mmetsp:Transcript_17907/g.20474  ORF Transcript_17907/g.20474 Transcript_17907/m.20474 type:complete len:80 (+) Transcript_17907:793-1032(+)
MSSMMSRNLPSDIPLPFFSVIYHSSNQFSLSAAGRNPTLSEKAHMVFQKQRLSPPRKKTNRQNNKNKKKNKRGKVAVPK